MIQLKIAIVPNLTKAGAKDCARKAIEVVLQNGGMPLLLLKDRDAFVREGVLFYETIDQLIAACDVVVTVGGDGTIIRVAKYAAAAGKPLLGINLGRIGFVAGLEPQELTELSRLFDGDYTCESRMMLKATVIQHDLERVYYALNDVTVSRGSLSRIIDLSVSLNEEEICDYRADGLLFSTPTGSTAYSLSAGGPVIQPHMRCILLTPVCPHSLFSRSVLFCDQSVLTVRAEDQDNAEVYLTVDGQESIKISSGDRIKIEKAEIETKLIRLHDKSFYRVLSEKLSHSLV